jgi:CDP-Glycerol:Poly(glycerophosphate) glycerophosphotransferase
MQAKSKKNLVLVISTGWGVRTFLQTDVLPNLLSRANVVVFSSPEFAADLKQNFPGLTAVEPLRLFDHTNGAYGRTYERRNYYFRHLARTRARQAKLDRYRENIHGRTSKLMHSYFLEAEARLLASKATISLLAKREEKLFHRNYGDANYYEKLIQKYEPDLVLSTVPHVPQEAPPILSAQRLGVKTACWVNSWDNLSTKAAYFAGYDLYAVWSNRMRWELLQYYPEATGRMIRVTGVPHFDWYRRSDLLWSREIFCQKLGLDHSRPIILHAMATPHLAPAESAVARQLILDLQSSRFPSRPQLILRLHPADSGERFMDCDFGDSVRLQIPGGRGRGRLGSFCPTMAENQELVNSIFHADVVVNLASTITIDAALCDRPVISIAFDPDPEARYQQWIDRYHNEYEHYQTVLQCGAARVAHSQPELLELLQTYLQNPELDREGRKSLIDLWCGNADGRASWRLASAIFDVIAGEKSESSTESRASYRAS